MAGRYRIERLLGAGGMGAVYKAWDAHLELWVALKVIRPELTGDRVAGREFERRFTQELLLARKITHTNVLRIHDLGEADGIRFITMPFIEGCDLSVVLQEGRLPFERALRIAKQLASGLAAAHAAGIVHRDLKPHNVLLGAGDHVCISDFGLAKSAAAGGAHLTAAGEFLGTPRYISPEQVKGQPADRRSDLYAFGLILYEMVTGETPFHAPSPLELAIKRTRERPSSPSLLNPDLPVFFERVVMRCLEQDPADRYDSAAEILADLEQQQTANRAFGAANLRTVLVPQHGGWIAGALTLLLCLTIAGTYVGIRSMAGRSTLEGPASTSMDARRHLAVLPFRLMGDPEGLGYLAGAMSEALAAKLFHLRDLTVASSAAVERALAKEEPQRIAQELGVTLLVAGSIQPVGDRLRLVVSLDDVASGQRLWTQEFSGVAEDILTIEDRIYTGLLRGLGLSEPEEFARNAVGTTMNVAAYDHYLRGRNAMRGQQDPRNVEEAVRLFEAAIAQDPGFTLAYTGLANASMRMYRETREPLWADRAMFAAEQARLRDETLPEVHSTLGNVYAGVGRTAEALAELRRAADLAPNSDDVLRQLGRAYLNSGQADDALLAYARAVEINPFYWVNHSAIGAAYLQVGSYNEAATAFRRVIELEPENVNGHNDLGAAYMYLGQFDDAVAAFDKAISLLPNSESYTNLGIAQAFSGEYAQALAPFARAVELNPRNDMFVGNLADGYRWAGQREQALTTYDRAISLAYSDLRVNPRNASTLGNLGLYYAKKGDDHKAQNYARQALAIDGANVTLHYSQTLVHAMAQRQAEAFAALERALEAGYPVALARVDPDLRDLRADARFEPLVARFASAR